MELSILGLRRNPLQDYVCPGCGVTYNTLQAVDLIDPKDGEFHCQICGQILAPLLDGQGAAGDDATRRERKKRMRELQAISAYLAWCFVSHPLDFVLVVRCLDDFWDCGWVCAGMHRPCVQMCVCVRGEGRRSSLT